MLFFWNFVDLVRFFVIILARFAMLMGSFAPIKYMVNIKIGLPARKQDLFYMEI